MGPMVRKACRRHLDDLDRGQFKYSENCTAHIVDFIEKCLTLVDVGKPFLLEPWQCFIVGSLFGWLEPHERRGWVRRYTTGYIEVGKGNGKSPMAAAIGLYGLLMDEEYSAGIYAAATSKDQAAAITFRDAMLMAKKSPSIRKRTELDKFNIAHPASNSFFRPVSSDPGTLQGIRVHMVLIDEIHEHKAPILVETLRASTKGRDQSLVLEITNSGFNRESICWRHHEYSRQVLDGTLEDDEWFAYVCDLDEGDDPLTDESCWQKTNPNLGVSVTHRYLRRVVKEAAGMPESEARIRMLNFCQWVAQQMRYINMVNWRKSIRELPSDVELAAAPCYAGVDLGKNDDFCAFVKVWMMEDGRVVVKPRFWIPQATVDRVKSRPYQFWQSTEALTVSPGDVTDLHAVQKAILEDCQTFSIRKVAFDDRYAEQMRQYLEGFGVVMVKTYQGFNLNEALVTMTRLLSELGFWLEDNPVLTWMADNFIVRLGAYGQIRPDKEAANEKIDGIVALNMALDVISKEPTKQRSVYSERGATRV